MILDRHSNLPSSGMEEAAGRSILETIAWGSMGLHFIPDSTTLPDLLHPDADRRLFAERCILIGESRLRGDDHDLDLPLGLRIGQKPNIIALTGESRIGKTTQAASLIKVLNREAGAQVCRTLPRFTTRPKRKAEIHSPFLKFIEATEAHSILGRDRTIQPRDIALACRFAWQWYILTYSALFYGLTNSKYIVFPCHLDTAILLKRFLLYGMHICHLTTSRQLTRATEFETLQPREGQGEDVSWWRKIHNLLMAAIVKDALVGNTYLTVDSICLVDPERFNQQTRTSKGPNREQLTTTNNSLKQIIRAMEGRLEQCDPSIAVHFEKWSKSQQVIETFVRDNSQKIAEFTELPDLPRPEYELLSPIGSKDALPLPGYLLLGPGERYNNHCHPLNRD